MLLSGVAQSLVFDEKDLSRRLLALQEATGYEILQKQGQRIFGGPPPGWTGPPPGRGTEIYCYRIPRDCFEDELVPVFASVGRIYELRLMIEFSGTNRTYCYVRYCNENDAKDAVRKLHNFRIRPDFPLAVTISVDNRRLVARLVPAGTRTETEVGEELGMVGVEGVSKVWLRGSWLQLEFDTHRFAALARRQLVPGSVRLWGRVEVRGVEWAEPETEVSTSKGRVLCARNIPTSFPYSRLVDIFNQLSDNQVETVMRVGSMTLVTLLTSEAATLVRQRSVGLVIAGVALQVDEWHAPAAPRRRVDRGYIPPSPNHHLSRWNHSDLQREGLASPNPPIQQLSNLEDFVQRAPAPESNWAPSTLVSAEVELRRLCISQGWGAPSVHLTGQRVANSGFQVEYQASVMVIGLPTLLNGPWCIVKDEARATAASSALSRILQGAVKLPSKAKLGTVGANQNNKQAAGDQEEFQQCRNQDMIDRQAAGDVKFDRKVWQEEGAFRTGTFGWKGKREPGVKGEGVFGRGSRGNKEADEVEVMTNARGTLFSNSKQGVDADDVAVTVKREGEASIEVMLQHGIRGMECFGKWSPRWNRREDFGNREVEEFTSGIHNLSV